MSLTINANGSIDVSGQWPAETTFDDAQAQATLLPINLEGMNPVLPVLANEPAFPTDPAENYPTDFPTADERQPIDPFSGMMAYTPFPPDVAAAAAARQAPPGCKVMSPPVNFKVSGNVTSSFTTVLGDPYLITLSGSAKISGSPVGPWRIFTENPFAPGEPAGIITTQTANSVAGTATLGGDGVYRLAMFNDSGCISFTSGSFVGASPTGDCGCMGYVGGLTIFSPSNLEDRWYAEAATPFTMTGAW
jgi:hypothetical protein